MEYYSAIKKMMDLEIIIPSEVSQTEKDKISYDFTNMWNLNK